MTKRFTPTWLLALLCTLASSAALADGTIYLCIDAKGHKEFTDINRANCKPLDIPNTIPAPTRRPERGNVPLAPLGAPRDFPRVDNAQQKARDNERRQILEDELRAEERKLGELKTVFNNGEPERNGNERNYAKYQERVAQMRDDIARTEKNIDALKREIASVK